jgi:hypothetical protein
MYKHGSNPKAGYYPHKLLFLQYAIKHKLCNKLYHSFGEIATKELNGIGQVILGGMRIQKI